MKQKFQEGDQVRVTKGRHKGLTGTILGSEKRPYIRRVVYRVNVGNCQVVEAYSYELAVSKFSVGDRVRCVYSGLPYSLDTGIVVQVSNNKPVIDVKWDDHNYITAINEVYLIKISGKNMSDERTVKLTLKKARDWYQKGGDLREVALQAFTERELSPLPRTWKDFCRRFPISEHEKVIGALGKPIDPSDLSQFRAKGTCRLIGRPEELSFTILPSEQHVIAITALMKLISLRKAWVGDWEPNFSMNAASNWTFAYRPHNNDWLLENHCWSQGGALTFPTQEMAKDFLNTFKDLIEQAKILI